MSPEPITMPVGGIAAPATGPGRVVQETSIGRLTGIGGHPGARENGNRPSRWGSGEAVSTVSAAETGHPDPPGTAQRPKMARSPLPMGSDAPGPGHSVTRRNAPTNRRIPTCPPKLPAVRQRQSCPVSGGPSSSPHSPSTVHQSGAPLPGTDTDPCTSAQVFGMDRNHRSTSSEYGPDRRRDRDVRRVRDGMG